MSEIMGNIDDISLDLPAPRDDEPQSLRTDIIDELTDHLQSAFHRELHTRTTDPDPEPAARQRVLSRFGNPSTIARRLWYDAMQERIMSQRIATAAAVVAAVACLGMFVFMWQSSAANRAMLQQSQQMNSELLEQMQGLAVSLSAGRSEDNRPAEWNQLQVRCVADSEDGSPMEGIRIRLESASENTVGIPPATITTDAEGLVDFGLVLYGQYTVDLAAPNGMRTRRQISVRPGHDTLETFVCPAGDGLADLQVEPLFEAEAAAPESLRERIWYLVSLIRETHTSSVWSRPARDSRRPDVVHCFCGPNGELIAVDEQERDLTPAEDLAGPFGPVTQYVWKLPEGAAGRETLRIEPGYYSFGEGAVCVMDDSDPSGRTLHQIMILDSDRRSSSDDPTTVAWDRMNSLTFPLDTTTFVMLNRIVEAAPQLEVATLEIRLEGVLGDWDGGRLPFSRSMGDNLTFGSRVALSTTSLNRRRRSPEDPPPPDPLLTGVEVISLVVKDPSAFTGATRAQVLDLKVLLTPEEKAILGSLDRPLYAALVPLDTERTSLDPAVKAQLLEELDSAAAESE